MKRYPSRYRLGLIACFLGANVASCLADQSVVVSATADPKYTAQKYDQGKIRPEKYVVMIGHYFEGHVVDKSIDRIPFSRIANVFAPELARREYWPAKGIGDADLLIVVHWGTTVHQASMLELLARTSPLSDIAQVNAERQERIGNATEDAASTLFASGDEGALIRQFDVLEQLSDALSTDYSRANSAQLLGYTKALRELGQRPGFTVKEATLRSDLESERYFIILKAYSLHEKRVPGREQKAVWTLHLNMHAPGTNFQTALSSMSVSAVDFFGRTTDEIATVTPHKREGKVEVGEPVVVTNKK